MEENEDLDQIFASLRMPGSVASSPSLSADAPTPAAPSPINPQVKDYLTKKFDLGNYSDENRAKLVEENNKYDLGGRSLAALGALGAGFLGKDPLTAGSSLLKSDKDAKAAKLDQFDKGRANTIQNYQLDRQVGKDAIEDSDVAGEMDPTSDISETYRTLAQKFAPGMSFDGKSARDLKKAIPSLETLAKINSASADRKEARDERRFQQGIKATEKTEALQTPYGTAHSIDDAKKLKDAHESKMNFDNKLDEMIGLREKHGGGAILNREDVARGEQLSKDLLLEYKNMAKLGVLSQADENIINAIIPKDPLAFNSPLASIQGQDPILHKLKGFKADSDKDFQNRVQTRIRGGNAEKVGAPKVEAHREMAGSQVRMKDPAGNIRLVPADQVEAAKKAGGTVAE